MVEHVREGRGGLKGEIVKPVDQSGPGGLTLGGGRAAVEAVPAPTSIDVEPISDGGQ